MKRIESTGRATLRDWLLVGLADVATWVVVLWLASAALGATPAYDALPWDSVCDLSAPPYGGSGTLIGIDGNRGLIATCSHTFHGVGTRNVSVEFRSGYKARAKLLAMDDRNDLALFEIQVEPNMVTPPAVKLARRNEGTVTAIGFPWYGQGAMHYTSGRLVRIDSSGRALFAARPHVHSGFSGGGLFNERGEYLGAISGYDGDGLSIAGSGEPLRRLVARYMEVAE